jgi:drug/metabolite transporter (DMT)-like permease
LLVAFFGAMLVAQPSAKNWSMLGVLTALLAAATETGIYLWFRTADNKESKEPWTKMFQMYGASGLMLIAGCLALLGLDMIAPGLFLTSGSGLAKMIAFNSIVGFVGYALRFYLIPNVSTVVFSTLSFFGVISAYLFGWFFSNETPTLLQGLGAAAIIAANTVILRKEIT